MIWTCVFCLLSGVSYQGRAFGVLTTVTLEQDTAVSVSLRGLGVQQQGRATLDAKQRLRFDSDFDAFLRRRGVQIETDALRILDDTLELPVSVPLMGRRVVSLQLMEDIAS